MEKFKHEIFEHLGNLFYAIAKDQQVQPLQFGELKLLMRKDWLTGPSKYETDRITEAVHIIILTMDTLQIEGVSPEEAFRSFSEFFDRYHEQFSFALKAKIVRTAETITEIFPLSNRLKNNHLIKLKLMFENSSLVV